VGYQPESRVIGAGLRTPAARLRIRDLERLKHLGFNLPGYGTDAPQEDASTVIEREADAEENDKGTDWPAFFTRARTHKRLAIALIQSAS
jgi:hypothetical protein